MSKVSKNIKNLRKALGMSQDALAEKLFVSRQAISSWENDRTQPDVQMIGKLSEIFGVSVEELLYGEKRNTEIDNEKNGSNKVLITVFSVLGSLLLGAGITILLVDLWERFPFVGKTIISFLPLILGQGIGVFTYIKKKDNLVWRECGAMLWSIGVASTVGMLSNVLFLNLDALLCLLIDAVLIIPIIWFFNAVTPLAFYYCAVIAGVTGFNNVSANGVLSCVLMFVLLLPGLLFTYFNYRKTDEKRFEYCIWVSVLASVAAAFMSAFLLECGWAAIFFALFVCLYALSKTESFSSPLCLAGVLGSGATSVIVTCISLGSAIETWDKIFTPEHITAVVICILLFAIGFIIGEKNFENNITKTAFCVIGVLNTIISFFLDGGLVISLVLFGFTVAQAIVMVIKGAQQKNHIYLNVGLIMLISLMFISVSAFYKDLLALGIMFIISGLALFVANFYITRKNKNKEKISTEKTVQNNE